MSVFQRYPRGATRDQRIGFWTYGLTLFLIPPAAGVLLVTGPRGVALALLGLWLALMMGLNVWTAARHARQRKRPGDEDV